MFMLLDLLSIWLFLELAIFIFGPIAVKWIIKLPIQIKFQKRNIEDFPTQAQEYIRNVEFKLGFEGFTVVDRLQLSIKITSGYLTMLVNRQTGDLALVTVMITKALGVVNEQQSYTQFVTHLSSGEFVVTSNLETLGLWLPSIPGGHGVQLPKIRDIQELYKKHCQHVNLVSPQDSKGIAPPPGFEVEAWEQFEADWSEGRIKQGYFYRTRDHHQKLTLKGAIWAAWGLTWPITTFRKHFEGRKTRLQLNA
ncbi:MAG: hypothetical protein HY774_24865 [Acidobacteria bacterium]|nr:hypothetical protein [Acidobacteriota bacterium]